MLKYGGIFLLNACANKCNEMAIVIAVTTLV